MPGWSDFPKSVNQSGRPGNYSTWITISFSSRTRPELPINVILKYDPKGGEKRYRYLYEKANITMWNCRMLVEYCRYTHIDTQRMDNQFEFCPKFTETEMLAFWWHFRHWLHWKLSFRQLSMQTVTKISSKWWHFCFSVRRIRYPWFFVQICFARHIIAFANKNGFQWATLCLWTLVDPI